MESTYTIYCQTRNLDFFIFCLFMIFIISKMKIPRTRVKCRRWSSRGSELDTKIFFQFKLFHIPDLQGESEWDQDFSEWRMSPSCALLVSKIKPLWLWLDCKRKLLFKFFFHIMMVDLRQYFSSFVWKEANISSSLKLTIHKLWFN